MKRFLLALPLIALASSAFAAGLTVTNHCGLPIDELFASAAGKDAFGANLMEGIKEGALDDGKTVEIAAVADGTYDFKISAPDEGVLCTIKGVEVKGGTLEFTAEAGQGLQVRHLTRSRAGRHRGPRARLPHPHQESLEMKKNMTAALALALGIGWQRCRGRLCRRLRR